jgi:hypothetical protein
MTDATSNPFSHTVIIDARSGEEWGAGHITGSHRAESVEEMARYLPCMVAPDKVVVIIHCEFSSHRGPTLAEDFRNVDRTLHHSSDIPLAFPETYLLAGGYAQFSAQFPALCYGFYLREEDCTHKIRRCRSQTLAGFVDFAEAFCSQKAAMPTGSHWNPFERRPPAMTLNEKVQNLASRG